MQRPEPFHYDLQSALQIIYHQQMLQVYYLYLPLKKLQYSAIKSLTGYQRSLSKIIMWSLTLQYNSIICWLMLQHDNVSYCNTNISPTKGPAAVTGYA